MRSLGNREQGIGRQEAPGTSGEGEAPAEPLSSEKWKVESGKPERELDQAADGTMAGEGEAPAEPQKLQLSILSSVEGCGRCEKGTGNTSEGKTDAPLLRLHAAEGTERTRGMFITLEGIEGSGKSTLASLLANELRKQSRQVIVTAEPGGCKVGEDIRRLVLHSSEPISKKAELLLFEAARAQHVDIAIRPALEFGTIVICDRYTDSSLAYQGYARGIDIDEVTALNDYATSGLSPDITFLLDLPAEAGLARQKKIDRISSEDLAFHEYVRQGFLAIAKSEPHRVVVLDATKSLDDVLASALNSLAEK